MAEIISEVLGQEVRFQQITFKAYKDRFVGFGMSDAMAQGMTDMACTGDRVLKASQQPTGKADEMPATTTDNPHAGRALADCHIMDSHQSPSST